MGCTKPDGPCPVQPRKGRNPREKPTLVNRCGARRPAVAARETMRFCRSPALANETADESYPRPRRITNLPGFNGAG
jgi:hypothetical protein